MAVIGCHLAHGEQFLESLADTVTVFAEARQCIAAIALGDFNVDELPYLATDPLRGRRGGHDVAAEENRMMLKAWAATNKLEIHIASVSEGSLGEPWGEACLSCPISRVP